MKKWRKVTEKTVRNWIAKGLGQGAGSSYRPAIEVRDVFGPGRRRRLPGLLHERNHHYLSDLEYKWHLWAEHLQGVVDIREQYALLPWELTQKIADGLGKKHSVYPVTRTPILMTSDLVVTLYRSGVLSHLVLCVKPHSATSLDGCVDEKAEKKILRTREKLKIEEEYWRLKGVQWSIVTDRDLPKTLVGNLDFLRFSVLTCKANRVQLTVFVEYFRSCWRPDLMLKDILTGVSRCMGCDPCLCFNLFAKAVWLRMLPVDIKSRPVGHPLPVPLRDDAQHNYEWAEHGG